MLNARSKFTGILAAAIVATVASSVNAAFTPLPFDFPSNVQNRTTKIIDTVTIQGGIVDVRGEGFRGTYLKNAPYYNEKTYGSLYGIPDLGFKAGGMATFNFKDLSPLFIASANSKGLVVEEQLDGKLFVDFVFEKPVSVGFAIDEGGLMKEIGTGAVDVTVGGTVRAWNVDSSGSIVGGIAVEAFVFDVDMNLTNSIFGWTATALVAPMFWMDQDQNRCGYTHYEVSVDNVLWASAGDDGCALIAKKFFEITLIPGVTTKTDVPEPASLGLLGLGLVGLMARRRK